MTEQYRTGNRNENYFNGRHISIELDDDDKLIDQLDDFLCVFIHEANEDILPYPAKTIRVESWRHDSESAVRMAAEVSFRPTDLQNSPLVWPSTFRDVLSEALQHYNYDTSIQTHDPSAVYIAIDDSNAVRIGLQSSATECTIDITTEFIDVIEEATHEPLPAVFTKNPVSPLELLRHLITILGATTDQLRDTYGNPSEHAKTYSIHQLQDPAQAIELPLHGEPHASELEGVLDSEQGLISVGGATQAKNRLSEIANIVNNPEIARLYGVKRSHFLLHGPPGTGKTSLVEALAHEVGATIWKISSSDLVEKWVGQSGKNVAETFEKARETDGLLIMFFDEFDALARKSDKDSSERVDIRKILNKEIEDIAKNYPHIIVAAATNADLDLLEPSLIRSGRIEPISVPLPTQNERYDIFGTILMKSLTDFNKDQPLVFDEEGAELPSDIFIPYANDIDLLELAQKSEGRTGADFEAILSRARAKHFANFHSTGEMLQVTHHDLLHELRNFDT